MSRQGNVLIAKSSLLRSLALQAEQACSILIVAQKSERGALSRFRAVPNTSRNFVCHDRQLTWAAVSPWPEEGRLSPGRAPERTVVLLSGGYTATSEHSRSAGRIILYNASALTQKKVLWRHSADGRTRPDTS